MSRGIRREHQVKDGLEAEGWWCIRAAASKGEADIVALKAIWSGFPEIAGRRVYNGKLLVEVKSTARSAFADFGPSDRAELLAAAEKAGATAVLAWWPPRGRLQWLFPDEWPGRVLSVRQDQSDGGSDNACVREAGL